MHDTNIKTATVTVCENMALFGASPERDEFDSREIWDEDDATEALGEAIRVIVGGVTVEGTQLADEREALLWGFVNMLHSQVARLDRTVDRIAPEMRDLERAQDGTEVKAWDLQLLTDRAHNLGDRRDAFETMRDLAADAYRVATGEVWRPAPRIAYQPDRGGASSPRPPSTPATSPAPARIARPARTCSREPWSR